MSEVLQLFILLPLAAFLTSLALPGKRERMISNVALASLGMHFLGIVIFTGYWLFNDYPVLDRKHIVLFESPTIEIFINFYFDKITAVFAIVGSFIALLVGIFSRYYIHRDEGFKRFFNTVLFFFLGYNMVVFAGNFESLFLGWEILGVCSFLLISFYRDRYLPVKNGLKVISVYRLGDVCLILTMWMSHQVWHQNITFNQLNDAVLVAQQVAEYPSYILFISVMVLIAAATKSAQLPFSSWMPRAMEGPTTSSAVFYGALSIHLGVFLLLRTSPYWESITLVKILIIIVGLCTSVIASMIATVQSTVKTQIAYASITQIGLIFVEVALGFHILALIHFAGNAFLRTYQLLVSPSVLSYLIHNMVFNFKGKAPSTEPTFANRIRNTFYMLSIKEWNIDGFLYSALWSPFKWIGRRISFIGGTASLLMIILLLISGIIYYVLPGGMPAWISSALPVLYSVIALAFILRSFTERLVAKRGWIMIITAQLFITLAIAQANDAFRSEYILLYLSGIVISGVVGYLSLVKMESIDSDIDLNRFHGHVYEHPWLAFIFLLACLGIVGFPFTPTFIGMDVLVSHIEKHEYFLIALTAISFIFIEIAVLRIYCRIFLGQHKKAYHPIAFRSS